ncbi:MAG: LexA family transcriptional regulator [Bacteroidia bacterium]|nr:LexA family transcriptional regulator [Bacteroidia bacterium]HQV01067.1 LexA family transcriptional regulator [Bacteroidia bacterium]
MHFAQNIKLLRARKKRTQDVVAQAMGFSRSTLNSYENALIVNPTIEALIAFSDYFKIAIDTLLRVDMGKLSERKLLELEMGHDDFVKGTKLRVLATTVDSNNIENIEMVSVRAKAGYTAGYNDPEYIRTLPTFQLPFLSAERKYRTFQISGDSMLPIPDKAYVTAEYVENWNDVKDGNAYIVLTKDDGIVFKVLYNQMRSGKKLLLKSLNAVYEPYEININEVKEIWKFINYISSQLPQPETTTDNLSTSVSNLHKEMKKISDALMRKNKRTLN